MNLGRCDWNFCGVKPLTFLLLFFIATGMLSFVFGSVFLMIMSSSDLDPHIRKYNELVKAWNARYLVEFGSARFKHFKQVMYSDSQHSHWKELDRYTELYYEGENYFGKLKYEKDAKLRLLIDFEHVHKPIEIDINWWIWQPVGLDYCKVELHENKRGYMIDGKCFLLHRLQDICLKVQQVYVNSTHSEYKLDPTYGGFGCRPTLHRLTDTLPPWSVSLYSFQSAAHYNQSVDDIVTDFGNLTAHVRSGNDPYCYGMNLTDGTMDFCDYIHRNVIYSHTYISYSTIGAGVLVATFSLIALVLLCSCTKTRSWMIDMMREEHLSLLKANEVSDREQNSQKILKYLYPEESYQATVRK